MEFRRRPRRAQCIGHQRAASRAELRQPRRLRGADQPPRLRRPEAQQFAEHLADLGRGDEIAGGAEGIARGVVAVGRIEQAQAHVVGDAEWSVTADHGGQSGGERVHALAAGLRARATSQMPTASIGAVSTMPMVSQPVPRR